MKIFLYNNYNIIQLNAMYETYVTICYKLHFFTFLVNSMFNANANKYEDNRNVHVIFDKR